jgi:hypothetical protein
MIDRQIAALLEQFGLPYSQESERLTFHMAQTLYHKIVEFGANNGVPPANIGGTIAYIAERDQAFFYVASERMIEIGAVQRLSQDGYRQAVKNLAYQIALLAIEQFSESGPISPANIIANVRNTAATSEQLTALDQIFMVVSYGAGVHPSVVDKDVGAHLDEYLLAYLTSKR